MVWVVIRREQYSEGVKQWSVVSGQWSVVSRQWSDVGDHESMRQRKRSDAVARGLWFYWALTIDHRPLTTAFQSPVGACRRSEAGSRNLRSRAESSAMRSLRWSSSPKAMKRKGCRQAL